MSKDEIMSRPIGDGGVSGGPPCPDLHRITGIGVEAPYRYRCIDCGHWFKIKPNSVDLDKAGEAGSKVIWESDHKLAASRKGGTNG